MKVFERIIESQGEPMKNDLWVKPVEGGYEIRIWSKGKWNTVSGSAGGDSGDEGGGDEGGGSAPDYKIVRLLMNGADGDSGYFESLAEVIDAACSGKYVGGIVVGDAVGLEGTTGARYINITLCEYAHFANGNSRVLIKDSDDYTLTIYDSPDLLRWLAGVSGDIMEQTDTPFAQYKDRYVKITMQGDIGAALEIGIEDERGGSKSVLLCDSDRYPYILEVTDGVITGISLFGQSTPEDINDIVLLSMDKVSPLVGCEIDISGTGIMNGGGTK